VGLLCGLQIWISMINHGHALWRVLTYQVLIWIAWLFFSPAIGWMARRFLLLPPPNGAVVAHLLAALAIAAIHTTWWALLLSEIHPYDAMGIQHFGDAIRSLAVSGLPLQLIFYCGVLAAHYAVEFYDKYRERARVASRLEASLFEARLHALELQIRPHFLFNTLNSISALVRTARVRARL
jgi:two-component system LytT family sensor kinase